MNESIKISVDTTKGAYNHVDLCDLDSLHRVIFNKDNITDCCGTIVFPDDSSKTRLSFVADKKYGMYVGIFKDKEVVLSLNDYRKLSRTIDVWGDDLLVSEGLFIDFNTAWEAIEEFVKENTVCKKVNWISPNDLPEDGNYI